MSSRPNLSQISSSQVFLDWYWLKHELVEYCRANKISYLGNKQDITDQIATYLDGGDVSIPRRVSKAIDPFDWHSASLSPETVITNGYRNTQNVRRFFRNHLGSSFKFNIQFMKWMKDNVGKTLGDAIDAKRLIDERGKTEPSNIPKGLQYNQYTRDFFAANPDCTFADARRCWAYKRNIAGHNRYEVSDLDAISDPLPKR